MQRPPTLLLLPGLDGTGRLFAPFIEALPESVATKVVTYPGTAQLSIAEHAEIATRQLPDGPVALLAESFSGLVALELLSRQRVSFQKAIFVASFAASPRAGLGLLSPLFSAAASRLQLVPPSLLRLFCLGAQATDAQVSLIRQALEEVAPEVIAHRLRLVSVAKHSAYAPVDLPALYLRPQQDRLIPHSAIEPLRRHLPRLRVASLRGPHFILQAFPTECARLVADFILEQPRELP